MIYDFWDYFWGWIALAAFFLPVLGSLVIMACVSIVGILGALFGVAGSSPENARVSMRVNAHDMDEDY